MLPRSAQLLQEFLDAYQAKPGWDPDRTERADKLIPMILDSIDGDILEIGALRGHCTMVFCKHATERSRKVFVVDPWDGRQEGNNEIRGEFNSNTKGFSNIVVHACGSEDPKVRKALIEQGVKFAFILIDGLHSYEAVANDISQYCDLLTSGGILCIDDWRGPYRFCERIRQSAYAHLGARFKELKTPDTFIEQYFVRLEKA